MIPIHRLAGRGPAQDPTWFPFDPRTHGWPESLLSLRADESGSGRVIVVVVADGGGPEDWIAQASLRIAEVCACPEGDTLLVDLDLRDHNLGRLMQEPPREGITDVILFSCSLARASRRLDSGPVSFVPAGTVVTESAAILSHPCWDDLVRMWVEGGTTVVLTVPIEAPGADAIIERAHALVVLGPSTALPDPVLSAFRGPLAWLGLDSEGSVGDVASDTAAMDLHGELDDDGSTDALAEGNESFPGHESFPGPSEAHSPSSDSTADPPVAEGLLEQSESVESGRDSDSAVFARADEQPDLEDPKPTDLFDGEFAQQSDLAIDAVFSEPSAEDATELDTPPSSPVIDRTDPADPDEPDPWSALGAPADTDTSQMVAGDPWSQSDDDSADWSSDPTDGSSFSDLPPDEAVEVGAQDPGRSVLADEFDGLPEVPDRRPSSRKRLFASLLILAVVGGTALVLAVPGDAPQPEPPIQSAPIQSLGTPTATDPRADDLLSSGEAAGLEGRSEEPPEEAVTEVNPDPQGVSPPIRSNPDPVTEEPAEAILGSATQAATVNVPQAPAAVPDPLDPTSSSESTGALATGAASETADPAAGPAAGPAAPDIATGSPAVGEEETDATLARETGTDSTQAVAGDPTEPPFRTLDRPPGLMAFGVEVGAHASFAAARKQASSLQAQHPGFEFVSAPVARTGGLTYRVLAGPAASTAEAERIRATLAGSLGEGAMADAEVRATGWAFLLGVFENPNEAFARVQTARGRNVPVSMAEVPINDSRVVYRVYSGAFGSEDEAGALRELLEKAGLGPARLTERMGRPVF